MVRIGPTFGPTTVEPTSTARVTGIGREGPADFRQGEVLQVELVKSVGDDEGIFRVAGRLFRALYPEGLTPGVAVPMRVVDLGPPLVLRLPDIISALFAKLVHPSQTGFAEAAQNLAKLFQGSGYTGEAAALLDKLRQMLDLPSDPKELALALERYFTKSGVFHEAFLARGEDPGDLKSILSRLLALLGGDEKAEPLLRALLSHVETFQARSLLAENPIFPFFLPWGEEPVKGEIELMKEEGGEGERGGGLVMRLDLPNLGHVESALWWYAGGISVTLKVPKALEGWLGERAPELEEKLKELDGMSLTTLRIEPHEPAKPRRGRSLLEVTV